VKLLRLFCKALMLIISAIWSRVGSTFFHERNRRAGRVIFLTAADFQRFRRNVQPPARFIYSAAHEGSRIVAAVIGAGRLVVTEEVSRATLFRIYEEVQTGVSATLHMVMVDELDTTVNDHYGGRGAAFEILDTTVDDQPSNPLTSTVSEVVIQAGPAPARILPFRRDAE